MLSKFNIVHAFESAPFPRTINRSMDENTKRTHTAPTTPLPRERSLAAQTCQTRLDEGAKALKGENQEQMKLKRGQPTKFTPELWNEILEHIAGYGDLIEICGRPDMPSVSTVRRWYRGNNQLYEQMRRA